MLKRRRLAWVVTSVALLGTTGLLAVRGRPAANAGTAWTVERGSLVAVLTAPGTLRAARSTSYRSPINGREAEIVHLVPEGLRVGEGDLLVRLETRDLEAELRQAVDNVHEAELALQVAELELLEATAGLESTVAGEGSLTIEESRTNLGLAERRVQRLRREVESLEPLLDQGFITGDELERSRDELETAEADLAIARRRASVLVEQTHPVATRRAELQLAQKRAQRQAVERRLAAARRRVAEMGDLIERCTIYAAGPGLVVYEEFMASSPRRKVRLGDRVTPSQGIVRVVDVSRMLVDASVSERSVHRVHSGQLVTVRLEAFPELELSGRIATVGALAGTTFGQQLDGKRFDVTVELDPSKAALRPEMTARVDILVGDRQDVVRVPINAVFESDGMTLVNVLHGRRVEARQVEVGEQNQRFVEVVAGVAAGDRVMLAGDRPAIAAASGDGELPMEIELGKLLGSHDAARLELAP